MTFERIIFLEGVAAISLALVTWSFRLDRVLGLLVAFSLALRLTGSVAMGEYLEQARGRDYLTDDEPAYRGTGEAIINDWREKVQVRYEEGYKIGKLRGIYPYWNALLIWAWGPSFVPMRLANSVMGTVSVILAFLLGRRLFHGRRAGRIAAVLVALSPSLFIWSLTNLREIFLGVGVSALVLSFLAMIDHGRSRHVVMFLASLVFLGGVRHYYAVLLGWLSLPGYLLLAKSPIRSRILTVALLTVSIGLALYVVAGDLMGLSVTEESLGRAVPTVGITVGSVEGVRKVEGGVEYVGVIPDPFVAMANLSFVMFGRFDSIAGGGRVMSLLLLPEWLVTFVLIPLALWAVMTGVRKGRYEVLFPAAFIGLMMIGLAWFHSDPWTTIRFRLTYWPLVLVLAAGGLTLALNKIASVERVQGLGRDDKR